MATGMFTGRASLWCIPGAHYFAWNLSTELHSAAGGKTSPCEALPGAPWYKPPPIQSIHLLDSRNSNLQILKTLPP